MTDELPRDSADTATHSVDQVQLPNGLIFHMNSRQCRGMGDYLRREIFRRQVYEFPGSAIRPDDVVVDIGANMGMFVLWVAPQAHRGRVIAVEPTRAIECLKLNVRLNRLTNVASRRVAVGDGDDNEIELIEYPGFSGVTHDVRFRPSRLGQFLIKIRYGKYQTPPERSTVPAVSLERIVEDEGVDAIHYLKIDCEGGEYSVLDGISPGLFRRIERIALEFHEFVPGQDHRTIVRMLESNGFDVQVRKGFFEYTVLRTGFIFARREL